MVRVKEKPLTTSALNRFLQTVYSEVGKTVFKEETKQNVLSDIAGLVLPVDTPLPGHAAIGYVLSLQTGREAPGHSRLPETMSDLKRCVERATSGLYREVSTENAEKTLRGILTKALRATEKEMSRDAAGR